MERGKRKGEEGKRGNGKGGGSPPPRGARYKSLGNLGLERALSVFFFFFLQLDEAEQQ